MSNFHALDAKGMYSGRAFWEKLIRVTFNDGIQVSSPQLMEDICMELLECDIELDMWDERYFRLHGEFYDDYCVPTYEEDFENGLIEEEDSEYESDEF